MENHAKYGEASTSATSTAGCYVNLFIASQLNWKSRGLVLRQETEYPDKPSTKLTWACEKPLDLTVKIRRPWWATAGFEVRVNGALQPASSGPGSYLTISRTWTSGDAIEISMPFTLRTESFRDNPRRFAFMNGPLVLAAPLEAGAPIPVVVAAEGQAIASLRPVAASPSMFTGPASVFRVPGGSQGVTLQPLYKIYGERHYVVYFDALTPAQWQAKEAGHRAEIARQAELAAGTVDLVKPGDEQNERDHHLQSKQSGQGTFNGRQWRDAADGWFSWDLKSADGPLNLRVTYWGSDVGRVFDVLVDGERIGTQKLQENRPNEFFDEVYQLPADGTQGKKQITVRFQSHHGSTAGGVFACRLMKDVPQPIAAIAPAEKGFFAKRLDYQGIAIKASKEVADEALYQARERLAMMLDKLPAVRRRLREAKAELHIIGRDQGTSDLPEWRHAKGKPFDGQQTIDQRTRGMGGLLSSCGEENLLKLPQDRYRGRDICIHEFAHCIQDHGMTDADRARFRDQYRRSLAKDLWKGGYAASNEQEYFAELSMWYFGTHGDLGMTGKKPGVGREGLRAYDPEACALFEQFFSGKLEGLASDGN